MAGAISGDFPYIPFPILLVRHMFIRIRIRIVPPFPHTTIPLQPLSILNPPHLFAYSLELENSY